MDCEGKFIVNFRSAYINKCIYVHMRVNSVMFLGVSQCIRVAIAGQLTIEISEL